MNSRASGMTISACLLLSSMVHAQQESSGPQVGAPERVGNYRTREERREAGLGTELTDWLTFSGLVEVESLREVTRFDAGLPDHYDYTVDPAVQAAFDVSLFDFIEAELILEYTEDSRDPVMDEFIVAADAGPVGFSAGRYYAPFGIYYSHFITGPLLEFAETRRDMLQIDYDHEDRIELAVFAFDAESRRVGSGDADNGWGAAVDAQFANGRLNLGAGYLSNLAESDEEFLREQGNIYARRVGAWNAYAVYEADSWDISFEILQATDSFREYDTQSDSPAAWNLESAYFVNDNLEIALRYERSSELVDAPETQYGVAMTWRLANRVSVTAEYLRADFKRGFVEEDDDIFADTLNTLAFWVAFEF